ncbi:MAG: hypothetical protein IH620_04520 [Ignavibacterium sp.]|nr:hypothetical protein [Ignavibacterium sp.]
MKAVIFIFLVFSASIFSQDVKFLGEDITFRLNKENFIVDGLYWFINETDKPIEKIIYYPFPVDDSTGEVHSISIYNISEQRDEIAMEICNNGLRYLLMMPANDTTIYRIGYRQSVRNGCAKYILTSTAEWNEPLEWAKYKLIADDKTEINKFSYEPDKLYQVDKEKIFYWERRNFLPEFDFVICIKKNECLRLSK